MNKTLYNTAANPGILSLILPEAETALDLGCGTGKLGEQLALHSVEADGVTFNEEERTIAAPKYRRIWVYDLENGIPPVDRKYDLVVMSHLLEHLADPSALMVSLPSIMTPRSRVVCAIPNMLFLYNRLKLLAGRIEYQEYGLMDYTHVRWYTRKTLIELFLAHGFNLDEERSTGYLPLGPLRRVLPASFAETLDRRVVPLLPGLLAKEFLFRFNLVSSARALGRTE